MSPAHAGRWIAYYRVSTDCQGRSGLGLEAQRTAVRTYLDGGRWELLAEYTEVESGKAADNRPELHKALAHAKVTGARLIIAKVDRLSRNAAFLLTLRDSGCKFVAADMPEADDTMVGIMAVIAQRERELISTRTREALAAAKRRGVRLGNPHGVRPLVAHRARGGRLGAQARATMADTFAQERAPWIRELEARGVTSHRAIAEALNRKRISTARGGPWSAVTIGRLRRRLAALEAAS